MIPALAHQEYFLPWEDEQSFHVSWPFWKCHGEHLGFSGRTVVVSGVRDPVKIDLLTDFLVVPHIRQVDAIPEGAVSHRQVFPIPVSSAFQGNFTFQGARQVEYVDGGLMPAIIMAEQDFGLGPAEGHAGAFPEDIRKGPGFIHGVASRDSGGVPSTGPNKENWKKE
jgi:hypothetical protein